MEYKLVVVKKTYQSPSTKVGMIVGSKRLLGASQGGVLTGSALGNSHNKDDVTYSRGGSSFWDDSD